MKKQTACFAILLLGLSGSFTMAAPLGTAFTYQGRLNDGPNPANGRYDLKFTLCDAVTAGGVLGAPRTNSAVAVSNGFFTVTLDFGTSVFTGDARWLEIGVKTNGGASFTTLAPRQPLTPTPYALYAPSAGNAALLNGQSPTAYAPATGSPAYVAKTGDTMSGALLVDSHLSAKRLIAAENTPEGGAVSVRNPTKTGDAASDWVLYNMTGGYGDGLQFWSYRANGTWWGPMLQLFDDGRTALAPHHGNVGIGTANPLAKLHVMPNSPFDGILIGGLALGNSALVLNLSSATGGYADLQAVQAQGSAWGSLVLNKNGGNVGIGTASPSATLDVNGSIKLRDQLLFGPNWVMQNDGPGIGPSWFGYFSGQSYDTRISLTDYLNPAPNGKSVFLVQGANTDTDLILDGRLGVYKSLIVGPSGNTLFADVTSGKVGIGTTSPSTALEVRGGPIKATGGLIIETRTSDPSSPAPGQIWLRTDL